jgi:hypothetical protein
VLGTLSAHLETVKFIIHCRPLKLSRESAPFPAWGYRAIGQVYPDATKFKLQSNVDIEGQLS